MGASNYTYTEATLSQALPHRISSHVCAFRYFGCVPRVLVPDNLKRGVHDPCSYEPDLNPTYAEMTEHYGCAVLPARPGRPRDKAKVETGVLIAQRWILAVLHQRTVYSLRGKVLPVVDLRRRFGLPVGTTGKETRIVVVEVNGATVGMIVDDGVSEVLQVSDEVVEPPNPIVMTD